MSHIFASFLPHIKGDISTTVDGVGVPENARLEHRRYPSMMAVVMVVAEVMMPVVMMMMPVMMMVATMTMVATMMTVPKYTASSVTKKMAKKIITHRQCAALSKQ